MTKPVEQKFYCVICGEAIAPSRVTRKAVTCSDQHARDLKNARRKLRDLTRCRLCNRPSTPEERAQFTAWRKSLNVKRGRKPKKLLEAERGSAGATPLEAALGSIAV